MSESATPAAEPPTVNTTVIAGVSWLMTNPPVPCPDVLTPEQAGIYLNITGKQPERTLKRYVAEGELRAFTMSGKLMFRLEDLKRFVAERAEARVARPGRGGRKRRA